MTAVTVSVPEALRRTRWAVDPTGSSARFSVTRPLFLRTVHGSFDRIEGELAVDGDGCPCGELRIAAASVRTGSRRRDRHLRSPDYFDSDRVPFVRFVATAIAAATAGRLTLLGELEAAGRSVPLELDAAIEGDEHQLELRARTRLDARELGMTWSPIVTLRTPTTLAVTVSLRRAD